MKLTTVILLALEILQGGARQAEGPAFQDEAVANAIAASTVTQASPFATPYDELHPTLGPLELRDPYELDATQLDARIDRAFDVATLEAQRRRGDAFDGRIRGGEIRILLERALNTDGIDTSEEEQTSMHAHIDAYMRRQGFMPPGTKEEDFVLVDRHFFHAWGTRRFLLEVAPELSAVRAAAAAAARQRQRELIEAEQQAAADAAAALEQAAAAQLGQNPAVTAARALAEMGFSVDGLPSGGVPSTTYMSLQVDAAAVLPETTDPLAAVTLAMNAKEAESILDAHERAWREAEARAMAQTATKDAHQHQNS